MSKKLFLIVALLLCSTRLLFAQKTYGHEWIDVSKPHLRMGVVSSNIYRISYNTLLSADATIANSSPNQICLFNHGVKIPIYVSWTGTPTANDYIEFYGEIKDGRYDAKLYNDSTWMLNPNTSLFFDTNYYYLTYRNEPNPFIANTVNDTASVSSYLNYCIRKEVNSYRNAYQDGSRYYYNSTEYVVSPEYGSGEGWGTDAYSSNTISAANFVNGTPFSTSLSFRLFAKNDLQHRLKVTFNGTQISDSSFFGSKAVTFQFSGLTPVASNTLAISPQISNNHGYNLGFIELQYPRNFDFGSLSSYQFFTPANATSSQKISISNFTSNSTNVLLYDLTTRERILHNPTAPFNFLIKPTAQSQNKLFITNESKIGNLVTLNKIAFSDLLSREGDFVLISSTKIAKDSLGANALEEYKSYKSSTDGGTHSVVIATMEELRDFFGYGHPKHPLAIRDYISWLNDTKTTKPTNVFLVGKGYAAFNIRNYNATLYNNLIIPSFGHTYSDLLFTTERGTNEPKTSIGRLPAENAYEIRAYLNKVKEFDKEQINNGGLYQTPANKEYMKWAIHLGGGSGVSQQKSFKSFLQEFEQKLSDTSTGYRTFSIFKNSADISPDIQSVDLTNRLNNGVSLVSFFGHSSSTIFDVGLGDPNLLTNKGKYPLFLANGCNAGNTYSASKSYAEQFLMSPNKGAIAFLASTNYALDVSLYNYSKIFYTHYTNMDYLSTIGDLARKASIQMVRESGNSLNYIYSTALEYNLTGDPSLKINHYNKPDYYIDKSSVYFTPDPITVSVDSFKLHLIVQNLAKATNGTIKINVERVIGSEKILRQYDIPAPKFKDTLVFTMPVFEQKIGSGLNKFNIKVESDDKVDELSETNNEIQNAFDLFIQSDDVLPIYPNNFGVVGLAPMTLKASTSDPNAPESKVYIQIDTTENFNSPLLFSTYILTKGGVIEWRPAITAIDSTVYYWRVSKDSSSPQKPFNWRYASFIYLKGETETGWNQSHYFQFKKDQFNNLNLNNNRKFEFLGGFNRINVQTSSSTSAYDVNLSQNSALMLVLREANVITSGITIAWIDGKTGFYKESIDGTNGWASYGAVRSNYTQPPYRMGFVFNDTGKTPSTHPTPNTNWSTIIKNFISQGNDGDYFVLYSIKKPDYTKWDNDLITLFTSNGFSNITQLTSGAVQAPFIFAFRKNDASFTPYQKIGTDFVSKTSGEFFIKNNSSEGYLQSVDIGEATQWGSLHLKWNDPLNSISDSTMINLFGTSNNQRIRLATFGANTDTTLSWIDAKTYPKLSLSFYSKDTVQRIPNQLQHWRVLYKDVPDLAINTQYAYAIRDSIDMGDIDTLTLGVESVYPVDMDSVRLKITISQGSLTKSYFQKIQSFKGLEKAAIAIPFDMSQYYAGLNNIIVEVNPLDSLPKSEKYHFNNTAIASFYVRKDVQNPLLDVTFDGVRIINNELVSSNPTIKIGLKDENKFLLLNDTSILKFYIKYPNGDLKQIFFAQNNVVFRPATSSLKNYAELEYKPTLTDGSYELIIVDNDRSGNRSGRNASYDYKIGFKVITKSMVSRVLNYPNPFSTSTQFIFTITGEKLPDYLKIQIMNIRGQVVREINKEELGPLKLGLNRTQYSWNGTDSYGDKLANGVYLYRVVIKADGKSIDQMSNDDFSTVTGSSLDMERFFKNNYGKMVILR